ncbi:MAG: LysR family transcriptional regulator [Steroidobacteraceae bacterium]
MKSAHLSRLDLNLLKVFAAVHRERHITRAGRALFISQSAVSHSLAKLRVLFGDQLFVRTPEGMQPTVLADRLADPIRRALQSVSDAMQVDQRFDPAAAEVEFSIGMTTLHPFHFLPEFYRRFEREAPQANLLMRALQSGWSDALGALDSGDVDLLLTVSERGNGRQLEPQRFLSEDLFEDPLVCVVSKHNEHVGETMDVETYARLPHMIMASDRVTRTWIDQALEKRGLHRRIAVTAPHPYAIPLLTAGTRLVSTVARSLVASFVDRTDLRLLAPPITGTPHVFQMIWSARTDRDLALSWLRGLVRDGCRAAESKLDGTAGGAAGEGGGRRGTSARPRRRLPVAQRPAR